MKESSSNYKEDGTINYVDRKVGEHGELGPFQMTRIAFDTVKHEGERFDRLAKDTEYAEELAARYLKWIYTHTAKRNWNTAVGHYNAGPKAPRSAAAYLRKIKKIMNR